MSEMILDDLMKLVEWDFVAESLRDIYDMSETDLKSHEKIYRLLNDPTSTPFPTKYRIRIEHHTEDPDDSYYEVHGVTQFKNLGDDQNIEGYKPEDEVVCGIEFTPWGEWLGMEIERETLDRFDPPKIVALCLWEMSFSSFDENNIQKTWGELKSFVDIADKEGIEGLEKRGLIGKAYSSVDEMKKDILKEGEAPE